MRVTHATIIALLLGAWATAMAGADEPLPLERAPAHDLALIDDHVPDLREVTEANTDLWGEAAMKQPGGPSYEFFAKLLPPLRYVDANFRCYPIVLSAPNNRTKARLVSDGSSVNARARSLTWSHE